MSLLTNILGAALGGGQTNNQSGDGLGGLGALAGMLGGGQQGGGASMAALIPMLAPIIGNLLANNGSHGGMAGLTNKFQEAGLGDVLGSWIGTGQNQPISADQLTQVLGSDTMGQIAGQLGLSHGDAAGAMSSLLPDIINQLTPHGQVPTCGLGSTGDLMGALGGLLGAR